MKTLTIGTKVTGKQSIHWTKHGTVIDVGTDGRVRVQWTHLVYPSGNERPEVRKTWIKSSMLVVSD